MKGRLAGTVQKSPDLGTTLARLLNDEQAPEAPGARQAPSRGRPRVAADAGEGWPPPPKRVAWWQNRVVPGFEPCRILPYPL